MEIRRKSLWSHMHRTSWFEDLMNTIIPLHSCQTLKPCAFLHQMVLKPVQNDNAFSPPPPRPSIGRTQAGRTPCVPMHSVIACVAHVVLAAADAVDGTTCRDDQVWFNSYSPRHTKTNSQITCIAGYVFKSDVCLCSREAKLTLAHWSFPNTSWARCADHRVCDLLRTSWVFEKRGKLRVAHSSNGKRSSKLWVSVSVLRSHVYVFGFQKNVDAQIMHLFASHVKQFIGQAVSHQSDKKSVRTKNQCSCDFVKILTRGNRWKTKEILWEHTSHVRGRGSQNFERTIHGLCWSLVVYCAKVPKDNSPWHIPGLLWSPGIQNFGAAWVEQRLHRSAELITWLHASKISERELWRELSCSK